MKYLQQSHRKNKKQPLSKANKSSIVQNIQFCKDYSKIPKSLIIHKVHKKFRPLVIVKSNVFKWLQTGYQGEKINDPKRSEITPNQNSQNILMQGCKNEEGFNFLVAENIQNNYNVQPKQELNQRANFIQTQNLSVLDPLILPHIIQSNHQADSPQNVQKLQQNLIIKSENVPLSLTKGDSESNQKQIMQLQPLIGSEPNIPEIQSIQEQKQQSYALEIKETDQEPQKKLTESQEGLNIASQPPSDAMVMENQNCTSSASNHLKSNEKTQPNVKQKDIEPKQKPLSRKKGVQKVSEPNQYLCHCNTRGCRDYYCGCYRRGLRCSVNCLCSDCINFNDCKSQKKVPTKMMENRIEQIGDIEMDLGFGIEFEPVCFLGFGMEEIVDKIDIIGQRFGITEEEQKGLHSIQIEQNDLNREGSLYEQQKE